MSEFVKEIEGFQYLPVVQSDVYLSNITFKTCPGEHLSIRLAKVEGNKNTEPTGVPVHSWWIVKTENVCDRAMKIYDGSNSMNELLKRYAFQGASGCLHHKNVVLEYVKVENFEEQDIPWIPKELKNSIGIKQFSVNSGVCWFSAICWCMFSEERFRNWLIQYIPQYLKKTCENCIYNHEEAVKFRHALWNDYRIGDDITLPPEMDGRNGFSELTVWFAKLKIPMIRYEMKGDKYVLMSNIVRDRTNKQVNCTIPKNNDEKHALALRYRDGDHHEKHPVKRRIRVNGKRYFLVGATSGSRKCGHQIGWTLVNGWRVLAIGDADIHKAKIGPIFIHFEGTKWNDEKNWWSGCRGVFPVTKFGHGRREVCNFSPHNERDNMLDEFRGRRMVGQNSLDLLYFSS